MSSQPSNLPSPKARGPKTPSAEADRAAQAALAAGPQNETAAKRNTQKLQRAAVDGLEDVKAQDIQVFNTEALSALFERVIVASGTSNRQTKALAASVCDAVREAGFEKPRVEGQENGEWIVVDCGAVVVHVMQPSIRQYYRLEEIWGSKPVRLKFGAPAPAQARPAAVGKDKKAKPSKAAKADEAPAAPARAKPTKPAKSATTQAGPARTRAAKPSATEPTTAAPAKPRPARPRASPKPVA